MHDGAFCFEKNRVSATMSQSGEAVLLIGAMFPDFPVNTFSLNTEGIHCVDTRFTSTSGTEVTHPTDSVFILRTLCYQYGPRFCDDSVFSEDNGTFLRNCHAAIDLLRITVPGKPVMH